MKARKFTLRPRPNSGGGFYLQEGNRPVAEISSAPDAELLRSAPELAARIRELEHALRTIDTCASSALSWNDDETPLPLPVLQKLRHIAALIGEQLPPLRHAQPARRPEPETGTERAIRPAYDALAKSTGFPAVKLSALHAMVGGDLQNFLGYILILHHAGKVVLSEGDWSLSSFENRAAAIHLESGTMLLVRFLP